MVLIAPVPTKGVSFEVALKENLQALDQSGDGGLWVGDNGSPHRQNDVGIRLCNGAQALDEVARPRSISMVSARLCFRHGVLEAV